MSNMKKTYRVIDANNNEKIYQVKSRQYLDNKNIEASLGKEKNNLNDNMHFEVDQLLVTSSPHTFSKTTTSKIMLDVIIALLPATILSVVFFGLNALLIVLTCVASSVLFEWIFQKICKKQQ